MKRGVIVVLVCLSARLWCADAVSKTVVVSAPAAISGDSGQQLWLRGVRSPGAIGFRVYVTPASEPTVDPEDASRIGTVYFGQHPEGKEPKETFVLSLPSAVTGQVRVQIVPILAKKDRKPSPVELESVEIKIPSPPPV